LFLLATIVDLKPGRRGPTVVDIRGFQALLQDQPRLLRFVP
jgi:hypothetical protein